MLQLLQQLFKCSNVGICGYLKANDDWSCVQLWSAITLASRWSSRSATGSLRWTSLAFYDFDTRADFDIFDIRAGKAESNTIRCFMALL